jgi:two-component system sensor histidine kinase HydH
VRRAYFISIAILAIAAVLAFAAHDLRLERTRLLDDFAASQRALAQEIGRDLAKELQEVDEDSRLVATMVERSYAGLPPSAKNALVMSAFQALATVVRHYRMVGLFGPSGAKLVASDPNEPRAAVKEIVELSSATARRARGSRSAFLDGVHESGGRQFYLYAAPVNQDEVLVVASEARLLLHGPLRPRSPNVRYFAIDPSRAMWVGCREVDSCRALPLAQWSAVEGLRGFAEHLVTPSGASWGAEGLASAFGLPQRSAVLGWHTFEGPGHQPWMVGVINSAVTLESRERSLTRRLWVVALALVISLGAVAALVLRHLRRSAVLHERLRTAQQIAYLRERSEKIVENVPVGLIGLTRDGSVALVNRFLQERVGQVTMGAPLPQAFPAPAGQVGAALEGAFREAMREGRPCSLRGDEVAFPAKRPAYFEARVIPLEQADEDVSALVLVEDLSELKRLEHQLVRAEKMVTTGVLTAGLAHEIGTPMTIIRGRAESLLERVTEPGIRRDLASVIAQIDHISAIIRRVLDFSRAQPVEVKPTDVRAAAASVVSMLEWRFRGKSLTVEVVGPDGLPAVAADPDQLQQVLVNLLMNGCDACARRGRLTVRLAVDPGPVPGVRIEISDDGCGIPAGNLNAVFDPFFTTKKRGEGTGLGLSVVASIVRNHYGEVSLTSQEGQGTTVTVFWPAVVARPERAHG